MRSITARRTARAVAVLLLAGGSCCAADPLSPRGPDDGETASAACLALSEANRRTGAAVRAALAAVRDDLRRAEDLRDWFGHERFGPYVMALREQRNQLQANLDSIAETECPRAHEPR